MSAKKKKRSQDKRIKVDVWVGEGLRVAIGDLVRDDGKPANDVQVRAWAQGRMDYVSSKVVDLHEENEKVMDESITEDDR